MPAAQNEVALSYHGVRTAQAIFSSSYFCVTSSYTLNYLKRISVM